MGVTERKNRSKAEREGRIRAAARMIAATEGWSAVTIRRLAEEIEYSQPVVYSHFANRDAIVEAVATEGFSELARALTTATQPNTDRRLALRKAAHAYLGFAFEQPALYQAMFTMPIRLRFAEGDTKPELRAGFAALAGVVTPSGSHDEVAAETFWAALHGLVELEVSGRIRHSARDERVALLVDRFFLSG